MKKLMFVIISLCVACSLLTSCVSDADVKDQMNLFEGAL